MNLRDTAVAILIGAITVVSVINFQLSSEVEHLKGLLGEDGHTVRMFNPCKTPIYVTFSPSSGSAICSDAAKCLATGLTMNLCEDAQK